MSFSEKTKLIAMAIVHIFETSKPFGEFDAYAVLNDGAGVSYGLSQFTHRSGSLFAVIEKYLELGGTVSAEKFRSVLPDLKKTSVSAISRTAADKQFKSALKAAAKTPEMQQAQSEIAQSKYFQKAVRACAGSKFTLPMSLAVIYDSINHGSFEKIRDQVVLNRKLFRSDEDYEKAWITTYVKNRDAWLESVPRLKKTDYRTDFFLAQIGRGNWTLNLPLNVHGFNLTEKYFVNLPDSAAAQSATKPAEDSQTAPKGDSNGDPAAVEPGNVEDPVNNEPPPNINTPVQNADAIVNVEAEKTVPENFTPETKEISAPAKEGATDTSVKMTVAGIAVPAFFVALIKSIQDLIAQGFISASDVGGAVVGFISQNQKYVFILIAAIILLLAIKKITKQITLWVQMWILSDPNRHDVVVKVAESPKPSKFLGIF